MRNLRPLLVFLLWFISLSSHCQLFHFTTLPWSSLNLLNRLPLDRLPKFISQLLLSSPNVLDPHVTSIISIIQTNQRSTSHPLYSRFYLRAPQHKALQHCQPISDSHISYQQIPYEFRIHLIESYEHVDSYLSDFDDPTHVEVVAPYSQLLPLSQYLIQPFSFPSRSLSLYSHDDVVVFAWTDFKYLFRYDWRWVG